MTTCYIYVLIDPQTNEGFYVGSSIFPESRFLEHIRGNTNEAKQKRIKQIMKNGYKPAISILEETTEELRWKREKAWIDLLQQTGISLTNIVHITEKIEQKQILARISDELHLKVKLKAVREGKSITQVISELLENWVNNEENRNNGERDKT